MDSSRSEQSLVHPQQEADDDILLTISIEGLAGPETIQEIIVDKPERPQWILKAAQDSSGKPIKFEYALEVQEEQAL